MSYFDQGWGPYPAAGVDAHATKFDPVLLPGHLGDCDGADDLLAVRVLGHEEGVVPVGSVVGELPIGHGVGDRATVKQNGR